MSKHKLLVFIIFSSINLLQAQLNLENSSLSNYEPGLQKISALTFKHGNDYVENEFLRYFPQLFVEYKNFINYDNHQTNISLASGVSIGNYNPIRIFNPTEFLASMSIEHRRYISKNVFIPIHLNMQHELENGYFFDANSKFSFGSGIGIGRINVINEIAIVDKLIAKLKSKQLVRRDLTQDERFEFAKFIRSVKNNRFITNRGDIDFEYELLIEKLAEWNILTESSDAQDLAKTIRNTYRNEPLIDRTTGTRITLKGYINVDGFFQEGFIEGQGSITNNTSRTLSLTFERDKYINHKFQFNYNLSGFISNHTLRQNNEASQILNITRLNFTGGAHFSYLPSNNNILTLGLTGFYNEAVKYGFNSGIIAKPNYGINLDVAYEHHFKRNFSVKLGINLGYSKWYKLVHSPKITIKF